MKKWILLAAVFTMSASAASAQTEKGALRVGGTSNLGFFSVKPDGADKSENTFDLGVNAGYFFVDNLSVDLGVNFNSYRIDGVGTSTLGAELGLRYYFPPKIFVGAGFDMINQKATDVDGNMGTGVNFRAGYAAFISDRFALEPAIGYRLGLSDKKKGTKFNTLSAQVGLSFYF
jgi:outer membrane protein W